MGGCVWEFVHCRPKPKDPSNLKEEDLCSFAVDIARALKYLSEQNYVHRDVAARNVLGKCSYYCVV